MYKKLLVAMIIFALVGIACRAGSPRESVSESEVVSGEQVYQSSGCSDCHDGSAGIAPSLNGLYGAEVILTSGEIVIADEAYLRESILSPQAKLVQGYNPIMPDFNDMLNDTQIDAVINFIISYGDE